MLLAIITAGDIGEATATATAAVAEGMDTQDTEGMDTAATDTVATVLAITAEPIMGGRHTPVTRLIVHTRTTLDTGTISRTLLILDMWARRHQSMVRRSEERAVNRWRSVARQWVPPLPL